MLRQGEGTLTVDDTGNVTAETLKVQEGTLVLNGSANQISNLVLDTTGSSSELQIGGILSTASLTDEDNGGTVTVKDNATLEVTGTSALTQSSISGPGTLDLASGSTLTLSNTAQLSGTQVKMSGGTLDLDGTGEDLYQISSLNGTSGTIDVAGSTLTVNGKGSSSYSGVLSGDGTLVVENGTMDLKGAGNDDLFLRVKKATVTLDQASAASATKALRAVASNSISYEGVQVTQNGTLILGSATSTDNTLTVKSGGITVDSGSTLAFNIGTTTEDEFLAIKPLATTTGAITLKSGSNLELINANKIAAAEEENIKVTLMTGSSATVGDVNFKADFLSTVYENFGISVENGTDVVLTASARATSIFQDAELTPNSTSGSHLLWKSRFALVKGSDSVLKDAYLGVSDLIEAGDKVGAARAMAAIAGSTVNALGTAQRDALRTQMNWVRNRTTLMGLPQDYTYDDLPQVHMWIEGTGATAKLESDGDEGGYKLNSWGGTVGFDVDLTEHFTFGAALSAQYGDLTSSAAEYASGDLDSYYVSLFGRYQQNRWAHTLILTGAKNDATLDRYVDYGSGSYQTKGDTDGHGFGVMYELTYDVPLNEEKNSIFQP